MKDTKFTPGPWKIAKNSNSFVYALNKCGTNRFWLNVSAVGKLCATAEEIEANANLIAAAPDMYAALEELLSMCERQEDFNDDRDGMTLDRAAKALTKAGEL